jgi:hypothetical protein
MDIFFTDQAHFAHFTLIKNMSLEQEDGNTSQSNMSALCQKQTFAAHKPMHALSGLGYDGLSPNHKFQMTYDTSLARLDDIPGILALQEMNLPDSGGTLSVRLTPDWFQEAIVEKSIMVGRRESKVVGYVVGSSLAANAHVSIIQAMLRTFPPAPACYLYGPICVDKIERGRGLASAMFGELRARLSGRPAMLFIRVLLHITPFFMSL